MNENTQNERNSITPAKTEAADSSAEQSRRAELSRQVLEQFTKQGDTYRYKDVPDVVAFSERDGKLTTGVDNDEVAEAMTKLAESKGWLVIKAEGSERFYNTVERAQNAIIEQQQAAKPKQEPEPAPTKPEQAGANTTEQQANSIDVAEQAKAETAKEQARRQAIARSVSDQYRVNGEKYYFKDQLGNTNRLAFKDQGETLATSLNTERVTKSLVDLAESKGWTEIKVSGHKEFRRQAWRAATERDIAVKGYTPDEIDLASIKENPLKNTLENATPPTQDKTPDTEPRGKVIESLASAVVAKQIPNESDRKRVTDAIKERINSHTGPLPDVMMYDNSAVQTAAAEYDQIRTKAPELVR